MPKASQTLIESARIDVIALLSGKISQAFGITEDIAFHIGNGIAKPRGLLTYPTAPRRQPCGRLAYVDVPNRGD